MATLSNLLDKMIEATNENTVGVGQLSEEIADLKNAGIIIVQDGDTLTIGGVE